MPAPARPKLYHIVHLDRLTSIVGDGQLLCDAAIMRRDSVGTTIGMSSIKARRLTLPIPCHDDLCVGSCVPFYFCPRSIMLYLIHCANHEELTYRGGQEPIVHLETDMHDAVDWANQHNARWSFTLSNAGAFYFESFSNLADIDNINWDAVATNRWAGNGISRSIKEGKQAEFLVEHSFPWQLVNRIGVISQPVAQQVTNLLRNAHYRPPVEVKRDWYY